MTTLLAALAGPTQAASSSYVALGDSFSAGTGTRAKVDSCYRSVYGYPALLAQREGLTLDYQACSGATTADVRANQLGTLSGETGFVTMTIGGNDVGFASVITECAMPGWMSNCFGKIDASRQTLRTELPGRLETLYGDIRTRAPQAQVVVAGYPRLFQGVDCNLATYFTAAEMAELNAGTDELDALIIDKVAQVGFTYVDVRDAFTGHAVCGSPEWINGLSSPVEESYHPNRLGNEAYAAALAPALVGGTSTTAQADAALQTSDQAAPSLRQQADAVIEMDLVSESNLQRATAAGVDRGRLTRAEAKLHSRNPATVREGLQELQRLDAEWESRQQ